ncbi:MAG: recombinase family protein [Bacilli bacterium]
MNYSFLTNINFHAGIYIRLSQEDKDKKYESDSESVINQKQILRDYVNKNGFNLSGEYVDDGFSGTNFERPGFKQLLEDIKTKKINLVIVKDLSRLGRDHVMTGYYIETFFPENNIRFVSIVENYDSMKNQASNDSSTFIIACNDYYSKQNSLKIRNVLDSKRNDGKFIGSAPCYGYMRDPEDKGHLIIDPKTAPYVKKIFEWRMNDLGMSDIATKLTNEGAPTPAGYKSIKYSSKLKRTDIWSIHSVKKILQNRMYTGDLVQHTQTTINYKSKKKVTLDERLWIIKEDMHEAIIDKETFRIVNNKRLSHNRSTNIKTERPRRLLEGLLYCKECGNRLGVSYRKNKDYWTVNCNRYARDPIRHYCEPHFFPYEYLEEQMLYDINKCFKSLFSTLSIDELNNEIIKKIKKNINNIDNKIKDTSIEIEKVQKQIQVLYEDRLNNNISIDSFKAIIPKYENRLIELNNTYKALEIEKIQNKVSNTNIDDYTKQIELLLNIKKPKKELLTTLIEKIIIDNERNINILFKNKILDNYQFQYKVTKKIRNPYGRKGKIKI